MSKLLLLDLDGSIALRDNIKETNFENIQYAQKIKDLGFEIGICTGRPRANTVEISNTLSIEPMITSGGASVNYDHSLVAEELINVNEVSKKIKEMFGEETCIWAFSNHEIEFIHKGIELNDEEWGHLPEGSVKSALQISVVPLAKHKNKHIKVIKEYKDDDLEMFYWPHGGTIFIEIHKKNISKWSGLKHLISKTNYSKEDIYFLGDGINDICMMKNLTNTFCPVDANQEVARNTKYILDKDCNAPLLKDIYNILKFGRK